MAGLGARLFPSFSKLTSAQVNGYLMDQSIMRFANAAARDAAFGGAGEPTLAEGMFCYLDDTNVLQSYTGSAWVEVASSDGKAPRGVVAFVENTTLAQTGVTTITDITGMSVTFTGVAGRRYRVDGYLLLQSTVNGDTVNLVLRNSAGVFLNQGIYPLPSAGAANMCAVSLITTATGSTTFKLSFQRQLGTGTMIANGGGTFPAQLVVTDIGAV
jgi:hypothetical protein